MTKAAKAKRTRRVQGEEGTVEQEVHDDGHTVTLIAADGQTSFVHGDETFEVSDDVYADGAIEVPIELMDLALSHGFVRVTKDHAKA